MERTTVSEALVCLMSAGVSAVHKGITHVAQKIEQGQHIHVQILGVCK